MSSANHPTAGATTPSTDSQPSEYFAGRIRESATPSSSRSSSSHTLELPSTATTTQPQTLPALDRQYPRPAGQIDVSEALKRPPGRWTIQGQREANRLREGMIEQNKQRFKEGQKQRLAEIKMELMTFAMKDL